MQQRKQRIDTDNGQEQRLLGSDARSDAQDPVEERRGSQGVSQSVGSPLEANLSAPATSSVSGATYDNGISTIKIAFSCTCQPNMNEVSPHSVMARRNASFRTFLQKETVAQSVDNCGRFMAANPVTCSPQGATISPDTAAS